MGPVNGTVTRGRRSNPSCRLSNVRSSHTELLVASQTGTGRLIRIPVSCQESATVNELLGMMRVSGVEPVSTWTRAEAEAVVGICDAKSKAHQQDSRLHIGPPEAGRRSRAAQFFRERASGIEYLCSE